MSHLRERLLVAGDPLEPATDGPSDVKDAGCPAVHMQHLARALLNVGSFPWRVPRNRGVVQVARSTIGSVLGASLSSSTARPRQASSTSSGRLFLVTGDPWLATPIDRQWRSDGNVATTRLCAGDLVLNPATFVGAP